MRKKAFCRTVNLVICLSLLVITIQRESQQRSLAASPAPQTTITVTSPSGAATDVIAEGDNFFTHVLGERRDMNARLDLRWQTNVSNISVSNGIWKGTFANGVGSWSNTGNVFIHYPGLNTGAANIGPIGTQHPIDASTYRQLSFRMYSPSDTTYYLTSFTGLMSDGENSIGTGNIEAGWNTYIKTLSGSGWSGSIQGLRIFPSAEGGEIQFDWVRLTNPDTSPTYEITWTGGSGPVDIYCDNDTNFSNGTIAQIADNETNDGSFTWQTAAFPPGNYYIYIKDGSENSDYSNGPLTIVEAPILNFTAPSMTSGEDYATTVMHNPWDMDSWNDILGGGDPAWSWTWNDLDDISFDGQMHARVIGSDSFVYLLVGVNKPIDTSKYKYLTWRWYAEGDWAESDDRLSSANGWVTRFHYFVRYPYDHTRDMNTLNDVIIWEGWNTYTVDLSQGYLDDENPGPGPGWTGTKTGLRFDFMEAGVNKFNIHVDYVMLTADPTAQAGDTYDIKWTLQASDRPVTITLKYDSDQNPDNGFAGTIATLSPGHGGSSPTGPYFVYLPLITKNCDPNMSVANTYRWSVPSSLSSSYYIYAEVNDGVNVTEWYSEAPVVISP